MPKWRGPTATRPNASASSVGWTSPGTSASTPPTTSTPRYSAHCKPGAAPRPRCCCAPTSAPARPRCERSRCTRYIWRASLESARRLRIGGRLFGQLQLVHGLGVERAFPVEPRAQTHAVFVDQTQELPGEEMAISPVLRHLVHELARGCQHR